MTTILPVEVGTNDVTNDSDSDDCAVTETMSSTINLYVPPLLIILGTVCNTLTVITMRAKYFRSLSTSVYLISGALNDIIGLLVELIPHWLYLNFPDIFVRTDMSHGMCKFFNFYGWANTDLGIIITTTMIAERATATVFPLRSAVRCTRKRAVIILGLLIIIVIIKDFHFLISSDIVPIGRTERLCDVHMADETFRTFWLQVWPYLHLFYTSVCFFIIVISNSVIIYKVRNSLAEQISGLQRWRQLAPMLIGESVILVLLTFPMAIYLSGLALKLRYNPNLYENNAIKANDKLVFSVTFFMLYSNKCVNFFIYYVTGSRFREEVSHVFSTCLCRKTVFSNSLGKHVFKIPVSKSNERDVTCQTYL